MIRLAAVWREWLSRIGSVFSRCPTDADLEEELRLHLNLVTEEVRQRAESPEAARVARTQAGGVAQAMEALRQQRGLPWLTDFWRDLRFGGRILTRNPGFTIVAVLTLALGIGANTVVFTVADRLILRPSPFPHAERVHWINDVNEELKITLDNNMAPSPGNFTDWRAQTHSFDHMVAWRNWYFSVADPSGRGPDPEQVRGVAVSPMFFSMLGVSPALGRTFGPDEDQPGQEHVAILTDSFWRRRFAASPAVLNQSVSIDGRPFSIVGVLPPSFYFVGSDYELWIPLTLQGESANTRASHSIMVLARLAPNVTLRDAQADLDRVTGDLERTYPATNAGWGAQLRAAFPQNQDLRPALRMLLAAVGCVPLIACMNVGGLLLVRARVRQREMAVRAATGASRSRLVRQMLAESALITGIGATAGMLVATWGLAAIQPLIPSLLRLRGLRLEIDARVLLFTLGVAVVTSLAFGLLPALQASRTEELRVSSSPRGRAVAGRAFLVTEIALAVMLLVGATLLIKSLGYLQQVELGFLPERVLTLQLWLPDTRYGESASVSRFHSDLLRGIARYPEVRSAALVNTRPFLGWSLGARLQIPGRTIRTSPEDPIVGFRVISPDYIATLGAHLVRGRPFTDADGLNASGVALINQTLVRQYWPNSDPIGQPVRIGFLGTAEDAPWWPLGMNDSFTIVGVIGDIKEGRLQDAVEPVVYVSSFQNPSRYMHLLVRTASDPLNVRALVQREIGAIDPNLGAYDVRTLGDVVSEVADEPRLNTVLLWAFAGMALLLSAIGVYGVTSYAVAQRTREFAIRLAIGAQPRSLLRMVTQEGLVTGLVGVTIGLVGALLLGRTFGSLLYGVAPSDGETLAGAVVVVLAVALLACWQPAWRATKVDPMTALRSE